MTHHDVKNTLLALEQPERASFAARFFKTKPGEYAAGDQFLGLSMPQQHSIAKQFIRLPLDEAEQLLHDPYHECRMVALLIWVYQTRSKAASNALQAELADRYVANRQFVNNWDLVDSSCPAILGEYLLNTDRSVLFDLAQQDHLWSQRIAVVSTLAFIRKGQFSDTFTIAEILLSAKHDLIYKAVGWMLREVGKRNPDALDEFLHDHIRQLPRTALRNAIYSLSPEKKRYFMSL